MISTSKLTDYESHYFHSKDLERKFRNMQYADITEEIVGREVGCSCTL